MAQVRAAIVTPWTGSGTKKGDTRRPLLPDAFPKVRDWRDITGQPMAQQPSTPNLVTIEVVTDDTTLALIDLDARFAVLWSEAVVPDV